MRPLTMHRQRHGLRRAGSLFGSRSRHSGSVSTAKGIGVEDTDWLPGPGHRVPTVRPSRLSSANLSRQIPARHARRLSRSRPAAEREDARHERQFTERDAIHEILAPAVDGSP